MRVPKLCLFCKKKLTYNKDADNYTCLHDDGRETVICNRTQDNFIFYYDIAEVGAYIALQRGFLTIFYDREYSSVRLQPDFDWDSMTSEELWEKCEKLMLLV